jgi:hypothetical protein
MKHSLGLPPRGCTARCLWGWGMRTPSRPLLHCCVGDSPPVSLSWSWGIARQPQHTTMTTVPIAASRLVPPDYGVSCSGRWLAGAAAIERCGRPISSMRNINLPDRAATHYTCSSRTRRRWLPWPCRSKLEPALERIDPDGQGRTGIVMHLLRRWFKPAAALSE